METELLAVNRSLQKAKRPDYSSSFTFNIQTLIENMKKHHTWNRGELDTMILQRNTEKQILLTSIHKGTEIDSFQSKDSVTVKIIEGKLEFKSSNGNFVLIKDQFFTLYDKIKFTLKTTEYAIFLLTISTGTVK